MGVREELDNMDVVEPPGIPVKTKRLSPKQKRDQNRIGACERKKPEHASYAAAVINAPSLPVEVATRTQKSGLKCKDLQLDRAVHSRDQKYKNYRRP